MLELVDVLETKDIQKAGPQNWLPGLLIEDKEGRCKHHPLFHSTK